ncbi:hypothetical protein DL95DRAFT_270646, partial [Leptodontidium sp. 2 PMI_412]
VRLDPSFTVVNMIKICGLQVRWTESLEDHLRLDRRAKVLSIFSQKDFLSGHMQSAKILPCALLRETITTLNLLFPHWDPATQHLLYSHNQTFRSIPPFEGPKRSSLREFTIWGERLLELYEEVYLSPPDNWRQLWIDRRNPHQWWTSWIAVVAFALSLVSCVASTIQAW